jgi:hypothetical protein
MRRSRNRNVSRAEITSADYLEPETHGRLVSELSALFANDSELSALFANDNERFQPDRFRDACEQTRYVESGSTRDERPDALEEEQVGAGRRDRHNLGSRGAVAQSHRPDSNSRRGGTALGLSRVAAPLTYAEGGASGERGTRKPRRSCVLLDRHARPLANRLHPAVDLRRREAHAHLDRREGRPDRYRSLARITALSPARSA